MATSGPWRTTADLVTKVLDNLGVLASGQSIDPEDYSKVEKNLDSIARKLAALDMPYIADLNNIPAEFFNDLADIIAGEVCTSFGVMNDDFVMLTNRGLGGVQGVDVGQGAAAKSLRAMKRLRPTGETLRVLYY